MTSLEELVLLLDLNAVTATHAVVTLQFAKLKDAQSRLRKVEQLKISSFSTQSDNFSSVLNSLKN